MASLREFLSVVFASKDKEYPMHYVASQLGCSPTIVAQRLMWLRQKGVFCPGVVEPLPPDDDDDDE